MGSSLSALLLQKADPEMDVFDDELGISRREKEAIKQTWDLVRKDIKVHGVQVFIKFFTKYPQYQKLFSAFADVPLSELPGNKKLLAHATSVMYAVSSMVDTLDDADCLKELVTKITLNHLPRGVTKNQFNEVGAVIVSYLEEKLGKHMTECAKTAWEKLFNSFVDISETVAKNN